jgi:hypothetical protein
MPYWYTPHYTGVISFTLWALIIPATGYLVFLYVRRQQRDAVLFALAWFVALYLVWIPLDIVTDRLSFVYYFYPAVGAVCIGIAIGLSRMINFWRARGTSTPAAIQGSILPLAGGTEGGGQTGTSTSPGLSHRGRGAIGWLALVLAALFLAVHLAVFFILSPISGSYYFI